MEGNFNLIPISDQENVTMTFDNSVQNLMNGLIFEYQVISLKQEEIIRQLS